MKELPRIEKTDGRWQLTVDGRSMLLFSGEIHNSSASSAEYMEECVWPYLRPLNMNAVIAPVYWQLIEPREGEFDFELLDALIDQARRESMRLALLWFGLWKNGESTYVPDWVKRDQRRFFWARDSYGRPIYTISPFCEAAIEADARAFARLMRHIREKDQDAQTVIMIQLENEIGTLGIERDFSDAAQRVFEGAVPAVMPGAHGTWAESYGEEAPTYLMEYAYAAAVERIARAGQAEYALPMYVNAWLEQFPWRPGAWPCGCPVARFIPVWQACAPSVAFSAPDIYVTDFAGVCEDYTAHDNPLFIPEHRQDLRHMSDVLYAYGKGALCFAPFGLEDFFTPLSENAPLDNRAQILANRKTACPESGAYLAGAYKLMAGIEPLLHRALREGRVYPFIRRTEHEPGCELKMGEYRLRLNFKDAEGPRSAGFVIDNGGGDFFIVGSNVNGAFFGLYDDPRPVRALAIEEGTFENGVWKRGRLLNGDEAGLYLSAMPEAIHVRLFYQM